ncbi:MAG: ribonuclease H [Parcubacteria group bacterium QH_9_35_7]|nr:MAG: ribonuclease H [Parcubacteria group bacterium QH_9_35_7]
MSKKLTIYTDGGSRGNPGPAASGVVIKNEDKETIEEFGEFLEDQTNNFAEYTAIIHALQKARKMEADKIELYTDCKLVAQQLNRDWRVKSEDIQSLFVQAWNLIHKFDKVNINHVKREDNQEADAVVNRVLDQKT